MLSRDSILSATDLTTEKVPVPEWGGDLFIKTMSGAERDSFEQSIVDAKKGSGMVNVRARLAVRVIVDEQTHERVFSDADADALGKKSGKALDRVFEVAQRLCGIGAKDVKELEKN